MKCTGCGEGTSRLSAEGRSPRAAELFLSCRFSVRFFCSRLFTLFKIFFFCFWLLADSFLVAEGDGFSLCQVCFGVTLRRRSGPGSSRSICRCCRCGSGRAQSPRAGDAPPAGGTALEESSCAASSVGNQSAVSGDFLCTLQE